MECSLYAKSTFPFALKRKSLFGSYIFCRHIQATVFQSVHKNFHVVIVHVTKHLQFEDKKLSSEYSVARLSQFDVRKLLVVFSRVSEDLQLNNLATIANPDSFSSSGNRG